MIQDNCVIKNSIIAEHCRVLSGVTLNPGCILGYDVIVGPGCEVKSHTRLALADKIIGYEEEIPIPDPSVIGQEGNCVVWLDEYDEDEDVDDSSDPRNMLISSLARDLDESLTLCDDQEESESEESGNESDEFTEFDPRVEIRLTLERSIIEEHTFENASLELNTLKM